MGKASRSKGQRIERELAQILKHCGFPEAHRGSQTTNGPKPCDVEKTPWWIEAKARKSHGCLRFLEQAEGDSDGRTPLVFLREDGGQWALLMRVENFPALQQWSDAVKQWRNNGKA